ncbi:hypothetical protein NL676_014091 [Syzygium grande]|nr:hypothetical protein NL676_014091 [Syzygium grande]
MDTKKPYAVVAIVQTIYAGMFLLSKAAFDGGITTSSSSSTDRPLPRFSWPLLPSISNGQLLLPYLLRLYARYF